MDERKEENTERTRCRRRGRTRIRFDSVFGKYISTVLLVILASFLILAFIITSVLGQYARESKTRFATGVATQVSAFIQAELQRDATSDLSALVRDRESELATLLSAICESVEGDMTVLLTDADANVVFYVGRSGAVLDPGIRIPEKMFTDVSNGIEISSVGKIEGVTEERQLVKGAALKSGNGKICGAVFACAGTGAFDNILGAIMQVLLFAGIGVLLVALVAVYVITERVIGPLREMSRAAKSFAAGDFEVVVPVKGRDEVAELAEAFNQMASSLKNLEKMRSTFMANVSHDLRTPMTTISGFIDSILAGAIPQDKHAHYLGIVSGEVKRLSRLVSLTLDISRIQAGDRKFVMAQFDICETARLILISFEQKIENKRLNVVFDADEDNMLVYADRDAIYQILYNICDNAVKFSNEGGRLEIAIRAQRERKKVQVTVLNEGQGIPAEDIPYVFDQFYKGDKSRGLDKSGVGLGMFISKAIIDAHKEEIWVDSVYGQNCEFGFTLSAKPPHEDRKSVSRRESLG
ncbi:MAG: HAMP domain-containing histidine kinase [Clostridia bacterium]|nr:HAMP domain-containing histidine kinase [Clostridia bacterium]